MNHHFNATTRKTGRHSAASERDSSMRLLSQNATYFFDFCRKFASNAVRCENVLKTIQTFLLQPFTAVISDARLTGHWSASRTVPFSLSVQDFARFPFLFLHFRRWADAVFLRWIQKSSKSFSRLTAFCRYRERAVQLLCEDRPLLSAKLRNIPVSKNSRYPYSHCLY